MSNPVAKTAGVQHIAPPLAPVAIHDILRDADALLALMGKETLGVVGELANTLRVSAHEAGAWEIEEAASNVTRLVSSGGPSGAHRRHAFPYRCDCPDRERARRVATAIATRSLPSTQARHAPRQCSPALRPARWGA